MIIDCISDLHGYFPKLEGGDLLIVAGDLTARDKRDEYIFFCHQIRHSGYKKVVVTPGNHDNLMQKEPDFFLSNDQVSVLCDSGTEFEGLKIWGSPWTLRFPGMNPHCMAFTCDTEQELAEKWKLIPEDVDILITHSPPYGIFDEVKNIKPKSMQCIPNSVGSISLRAFTLDGNTFKKKKLHVFGHIHECGGKSINMASCQFVNASHVNEQYQPVNKPIRVCFTLMGMEIDNV